MRYSGPYKQPLIRGRFSASRSMDLNSSPFGLKMTLAVLPSIRRAFGRQPRIRQLNESPKICMMSDLPRIMTHLPTLTLPADTTLDRPAVSCTRGKKPEPAMRANVSLSAYLAGSAISSDGTSSLDSSLDILSSYGIRNQGC